MLKNSRLFSWVLFTKLFKVVQSENRAYSVYFRIYEILIIANTG